MNINFTDEFRQHVRRLGRRYRSIRGDLTSLLEQLEAGETPGDQIQGTGYTVYKARVKNSDARRGKTGGYRVIYYIQTESSVTLLAMYSKSDQADIGVEAVRRILGHHLERN
ncbi:MAG: addiction module antitoxin [Gammaproteobacteria bacterium]|nr:MAG: addiction module antitoxin [Gammaproteobacteria bacterium]